MYPPCALGYRLHFDSLSRDGGCVGCGSLRTCHYFVLNRPSNKSLETLAVGCGTARQPPASFFFPLRILSSTLHGRGNIFSAQIIKYREVQFKNWCDHICVYAIQKPAATAKENNFVKNMNVRFKTNIIFNRA